MTILKNKTFQITKDLSQALKDLGVDLKITNSGDLELSNLDDIQLTAGIQNIAQATSIKLLTEQGGNRYHPSLGASLPIGEKTVNAIDMKFSLLKTLRQDARYDRVDVDVELIGNTYLVSIQLTIRNTDTTIPLQFSIAN